MRKVYYRRKRVKWGRLFGVIGVFVLLVAVVAGGITAAATQRKPKFDDSILGAAYVEEEMPIPTATPKPTPKPTGKNVREPKFKAEMVSAYNGDGGKSAYLTFDDGPTTNITPKILDILKEKNAVATFFLLGKNVEAHPELVQRELAEGHALANHSYSHDYKKLYNGTDYFREDIKKAEQAIRNAVGDAGVTKVFRFPGGSFEKSKNPQKEVLYEEGYVFIDWNSLNGDAEAQNVPASKLLENVKKTTKGINNVVILMHDAATKQTTVDALPSIIDYLREEGYEFKTLKNE